MTPAELLRSKNSTPANIRLCGVTKQKFSIFLNLALTKLQVKHRIRPHSPRADFATENVAKEVSVPDVMREV